MSSFDRKKNIEDSIKDGLILTASTSRIFFALKAANIKPPKTSLDAMDIMKLTSGICGGVLVKVHTVYKKCISERYNKNFMAPRGNKITQHQMQTEKHVLFCWSSGPGQPAGYQHVGLKSFPMHISQSSRSLTDIRIFSRPS